VEGAGGREHMGMIKGNRKKLCEEEVLYLRYCVVNIAHLEPDVWD
jgi:hypothetical protein